MFGFFSVFVTPCNYSAPPTPNKPYYYISKLKINLWFKAVRNQLLHVPKVVANINHLTLAVRITI